MLHDLRGHHSCPPQRGRKKRGKSALRSVFLPRNADDQKKGKIISRILYRALERGVCHLSDAAYPPASDEQPLPPVYVALQKAGPALCASPHKVGVSCAPFSPLPFRAVVFFPVPHKLSPVCDFHSALPYSVRTFLHEFLHGGRPSCLVPQMYAKND